MGLTFSFVPAVFDVVSITNFCAIAFATVSAVVVAIGPVVVTVVGIVVGFGLVVVVVVVVVVSLARIIFCDGSHVNFDVFRRVDVCCSARIIGCSGHFAIEEDVWNEMVVANSPELCGSRGLTPRAECVVAMWVHEIATIVAIVSGATAGVASINCFAQAWEGVRFSLGYCAVGGGELCDIADRQCVGRDFGLKVVTQTTHVGRVDNCLPSFTKEEIHSAQHVSCFVLCNVHEILSELIIKRELFVDDLTDLLLAVCRDVVVSSVISEEDVSESCNCRQLYFWALPLDLHLPVFQGVVGQMEKGWRER